MGYCPQHWDLGHKFHPKIAGALKRRRTFDDLEMAFRGYRSREVFKYMSDESLRAYIAGIAKPKADGGFELAYSPEWEARIYLTGLHDFDLWNDLPGLQSPRPHHSRRRNGYIFGKCRGTCKKEKPDKSTSSLWKSPPTSLPLEQPQEVFNHIRAFLLTFDNPIFFKSNFNTKPTPGDKSFGSRFALGNIKTLSHHGCTTLRFL